MLTDLSTDTFFVLKEGKGRVVGDQTVAVDGKIDIYFPQVMSHIEETDDKVTTDTVHLGNLINRFVTKDEFQIPSKIKVKNAIKARVSENRILAIANKDAEEKYNQEQYPTPLYYLKRHAKLKAGTEVTILSSIGSIKDIYVK